MYSRNRKAPLLFHVLSPSLRLFSCWTTPRWLGNGGTGKGEDNVRSEHYFQMTLLARRWRRGERHKFNQVMVENHDYIYRRADYTGELTIQENFSKNPI